MNVVPKLNALRSLNSGYFWYGTYPRVRDVKLKLFLKVFSVGFRKYLEYPHFIGIVNPGCLFFFFSFIFVHTSRTNAPFCFEILIGNLSSFFFLILSKGLGPFGSLTASV